MTEPEPGAKEHFHLGMARLAYLEGRATLEQFESAVEHVLRGGHLGPDGIEQRGDRLSKGVYAPSICSI